jgi:hypothetical protein
MLKAAKAFKVEGTETTWRKAGRQESHRVMGMGEFCREYREPMGGGQEQQKPHYSKVLSMELRQDPPLEE